MSDLQKILENIETIIKRKELMNKPSCKIEIFNADITAGATKDTVFLDPAGTAFNVPGSPDYKNSKWGGGGVSGKLYDYATFNYNDGNIEPIRKIVGNPVSINILAEDEYLNIHNRKMAKYVKYENCGIIHVVSKLFNSNTSEKTIYEELRKSYSQVLEAYKNIVPTPKEFRMVTLSGGIFAGGNEKKIRELTPKIICELFGQYDGIKLYEFNKKASDELKEALEKYNSVQIPQSNTTGPEMGLVLTPSDPKIPNIIITKFTNDPQQIGNLMKTMDDIQYTGNEWHLTKTLINNDLTINNDMILNKLKDVLENNFSIKTDDTFKFDGNVSIDTIKWDSINWSLGVGMMDSTGKILIDKKSTAKILDKDIRFNKPYRTLYEWVMDPNPAPLNDAQVGAFTTSFEKSYKVCTPRKVFFFNKVDIAKANDITIDKLHEAIKRLKNIGIGENELRDFGIDNPDGNLWFQDSNPISLYPETDPLWRYMHKYLGSIMNNDQCRKLKPLWYYENGKVVHISELDGSITYNEPYTNEWIKRWREQN